MHFDLSNITAIKNDSRLVLPGDLCIIHEKNGEIARQYIDNAIENGAKAIVLDRRLIIQEQHDINYYYVDDISLVTSHLASIFYPNQPECVVAVTGTNGKTSVANFFMQICHHLGEKSATIGTLGLLFSDHSLSIPPNNKILANTTSLTTPDIISLRYFLDALHKIQVNYLSLEASSHGLKQNRMKGVIVKAAGFTNFSQDHLDYHNDMESYLNAKLLLFSDVINEDAYAILNSDIPVYHNVYDACRSRNINIINYGKNAKDLKLVTIYEQSALIKIFGVEYNVPLPFNEEFQVYNILCAVGLAIAVGFKIEQILNVLCRLNSVPGRLEKIHNDNSKLIYIDYSHTPDSLEVVLQTLKIKCKGKLYVIFGCGGNRDRLKRPIMGKVASDIADFIIITDDNPRNEDPARIRAEILMGISNKNKVTEIADRRTAILYAISKLQSEDVLLVAGKGHEEYQIVGESIYKFSDKETVESVLNIEN